MTSSLKAYLRLSNLSIFDWPRSHFYRYAWLAPPKTPTTHSGDPWHRVAALPKGVECWKGGCRYLYQHCCHSLYHVAHSGSLMCLTRWRQWLHCRREGAAEGGSRPSRFTKSSVMAQIHTKKTRTGEEHQERLWERGERCCRSSLWSRRI